VEENQRHGGTVTDESHAARRAAAQGPPRPDGFVALRTDNLEHAHKPLCRLKGRDISMRSLAYRMTDVELTMMMVEHGGPIRLGPDDTTIAHRLRISQRAWRTYLQALREAGTLIDTPDGSITQLAAWELERRSAAAARRRLAVELRQPDGENAEKHSENNWASAPPTPPLNHIPITPLAPTVDRSRLRDVVVPLVADHVGDERAM
jgi:hypothetical protein